MIDPKEAKQFAEAWIAAWNHHDLDAIMRFYADDIELVTPKLTMLFGAITDKISNLKDLRDYFEAGLKRAPNLHFTFKDVFCGTESIVIHFQSTIGVDVAVMAALNADKKITYYAAHFKNP